MIREHFIRTWNTLSDIVVLSLFYVFGFSIALLTEPWLHLTRHIGSDSLNNLARAGQLYWGIFGIAVIALTFWRPRWFGLVAVLMLIGARSYDFYHDDPRDYYFLFGQVVFLALAMRGTNRRATLYGT